MNPLAFFAIFLKAALFSTGGLGTLPSLHQDLTANGWAQEADFGKAIAIGQFTPGPSGLWVISLGYLTYGYLGAGLALLAVMIPPFLVLGLAAVYRRIEHLMAVRGMIRGLSLALIGLLVVVTASTLAGSGTDWRGVVVAACAFGLAFSQKVPVFVILVGAAGVGLLIF